MADRIYVRIKNGHGAWRYSVAYTGRGKPPANFQPPFFRRFSNNGKQLWHRLEAENLKAAITESDVPPPKTETQAEGQKTIEAAVNKFLLARQSNPPRTVAAYSNRLGRFVEFADKSHVRYIDNLTGDQIRDLLLGFKVWLEQTQGLVYRSVYNHVQDACSLLKSVGYERTSRKINLRKPDDDVVEAYSREQTERLFAYLEDRAQNAETVDQQEKAKEHIERYKFFLGSSLREREVMYLTWADIDFVRGIVKVRPKLDAGFTIKNHESRDVPIPGSLVEMLAERKKNAPHPRWVFVSTEGRPEGHFLRHLKQIALVAGLNCGQCSTEITEGSYEYKRKVQVTCETHGVCEHWSLHRFRKTRAIRWLDSDINIRKIQMWLGHESLKTTEKYLGSGRFEESDRMKVDVA